jgi:hypothetical protein
MGDKDEPAEPQSADLPENPIRRFIISRTTAPLIKGRKQHHLGTQESHREP